MKKPYRPDYKPNYDKFLEMAREKESPIFWSLSTIIKFIVTIRLLGGALIETLFNEKNFFESIFNEIFKEQFYIQTLILVAGLYYGCKKAKDELVQQCKEEAEKEADERFQADLDRYNHWLQSQDELYDIETQRRLRRAKAMREQSDEAALNFYRQIVEEQNIQNQRIISLLNQATQAANIGNSSALKSSLDDLDREFKL